ncbi:MAG: FG-GAP-like repeat-containing protein [Acidobacteriota bacterium]
MLPRVRIALVFSVSLLLLSFAWADTAPIPQGDAVHLNNLGVAYMNQQNFARAEQLFSAAIAKDPTLLMAHLNRGIALLNSQQLPQASEELRKVIEQDPKNTAAWYNLGLVARKNGNTAETIEDFKHAVELDANNADTHYLLGSGYQQNKEYQNAILQYQAALELNPLHASAEFGLARAYQETGAADKARQAFQRFQHITSEKLGSPMTISYGEMGRYSMAQSIHVAEPVVGTMIPIRFVRQPIGSEANTLKSATQAEQAGGGACMVDLFGDGKADLISLSAGAHAMHAYRNLGDRFREVPASDTGLDVSGDARACTVGDFDNDGLPDIALSLRDRVVLFRNLGHGKFSEVTKAVGITPENEPAGLTFVDYDHDGDLDLFVTGQPLAAGNANVLWRNNGNQTFTNVTAATGLGGHDATRNATLSDLNNDRAVDLVVTGSEPSPTFYANPREGNFHATSLYSDAKLPPTNGVYVFDFNKDGWMDVAVMHAGTPGVTLWRNVDGKRFERVSLPDLHATRGWGLTAIDIDNDGWIDLAVLIDTAQGAELRILRNCGPRGFQDVTADVGLAKLKLDHPRAILAGDMDGDGDADLVVTQLDGPPVLLRNDGGNKNHWVRLSFKGLADNKSALGTKVEIFSGSLWQKWEVAGATGYMGQGSPEILAGLGNQTHVDIVRMLWPTGVLQDELKVPADAYTPLSEIDRRGSSCPVLFAWNGKQYQFITDVIGAGVVGHWISPTSRNIPDPEEWIKVAGDELKPHHGYLSLRFGEPMEEVNFIDQLRLVAIDHPDGTDVYPNARFLEAPPFPADKVVVSSAAKPVAAAWNNHGEDVRSLLLARDHRYVHDFADLSYAGFANPHTLTLDIGAWTPQNPLRLLLHGYVEYFSASSMYAAWQAGLKPEPPVLQAQMSNGSWKTILPDMGFPAGLPRTITVDLTGKLSAGTRRLRIVTNLQIYWDQILVDNGTDRAAEIHRTELPLALSTLEFRGYPEQIERQSPGDLTYRYDRISATGPFARERGSYTHYGNVTPLLKSIDNHFVIFGSGEDIDAEFSAAALPPLPAGWKRDYFFYANGYVKDMDFYEASPFTVNEMPFHGMKTYPYSKPTAYPMDPAALQYRLQWNDRFNSGDSPQEYLFHYVPSHATPIDPRPSTSVAVNNQGMQGAN